MNFETTFPYRLYLNLGRSDERRQTVEAHFFERGLTARRQAAVDGKWLRRAKGYASPNRLAQALGQRLSIRRAQVAHAPAMFLFEDDLVLASDWRQKVEQIALPDGWGIFMLGALHIHPPVQCAPGLVRCTCAVDHHAIGFRAEHYTTVRKIMRGHSCERKPDPNRTCDVRLAEWQDRIPTYAAWPNLAWQSGADANTNYDAEGRQILFPEAVAGLH